jgi:hypothetical protein
MMVWCAYNIAFTLVLLLDDPDSHDLFLRCCEFIGETIKDFPVSSYVIHGIRALAWSLNVQLPPNIISYFEGTINPTGEKELRDAPIGLTIPFHENLGHLLPDPEKNWIFGKPKGMELGYLLSKWSERVVISETR